MRKSLLFGCALLVGAGINAQTIYFSDDFEGGSLTGNNAWTVQEVSNPDAITSWQLGTSGNSYAKASNYVTTVNHTADWWLISPVINLSSATTPNLDFDNVTRYNGPAMVVWISTDYDGSSAPSTATWTNITSLFTLDTDNANWTFNNSGQGDITTYISTNTYIAFQYTGSNADGATWEVDNIQIIEGASAGPAAHSIYEIQSTLSTGDMSYFADSTVTTGGIVTAVRADSRYYIQSGAGAWSGIYVYDNINAVAIGDSVTMTAQVAEFNGLTELKNVSNFANVSSGNTIPQTLISTAQSMTEDYEGVLVTMQGATCTQATDAFGEWTINDGSGDALIDDFIYPYTSVQNSVYEVTGIADYAFGAFKVQPRMVGDIVVESGVSVDELAKSVMTIYPNPSNGTIYVKNYDFVNTINVYNLLGEVVLSTSQPKFELEAGVYIVKIGNTAKKVIVK